MFSKIKWHQFLPNWRSTKKMDLVCICLLCLLLVYLQFGSQPISATQLKFIRNEYIVMISFLTILSCCWLAFVFLCSDYRTNLIYCWHSIGGPFNLIQVFLVPYNVGSTNKQYDFECLQNEPLRKFVLVPYANSIIVILQ